MIVFTDRSSKRVGVGIRLGMVASMGTSTRVTIVNMSQNPRHKQRTKGKSGQSYAPWNTRRWPNSWRW